MRRNPRLRVGVYNQHFVDRLPMEEDPVTYLRRLYSEETYQSCRNKLGKYGLEGHAHTIPIRDLSGGQKARVVFVELSLLVPTEGVVHSETECARSAERLGCVQEEVQQRGD